MVAVHYAPAEAGGVLRLAGLVFTLATGPAANATLRVVRSTAVDDEFDEEELAYSGRTGGRLVHDSLVECGVDTVFGYSGGANLPILDQFHNSPMRFVVNRSEQCCGHAAEGYARSSGRVGVILTTSGPGLTNIITPLQALKKCALRTRAWPASAKPRPPPILPLPVPRRMRANARSNSQTSPVDGPSPLVASPRHHWPPSHLSPPPTIVRQDARGDSTPIVALSGQVPTAAVGSDAFQECMAVDLTRPCTKWSYQVQSVEEVRSVVHEAFRVASSGKPGPVHLDLPKDVMTAVLRGASLPLPLQPPPTPIDQRALKKVAHLLKIAKKPIFYVGQVVSTSAYHT